MTLRQHQGLGARGLNLDRFWALLLFSPTRTCKRPQSPKPCWQDREVTRGEHSCRKGGRSQIFEDLCLSSTGKKLPQKKSSELLMARQMNHGKSGTATSRYRTSIGFGYSPDSCQQAPARRASCDPYCQASRQSPGNNGLHC